MAEAARAGSSGSGLTEWAELVSGVSGLADDDDDDDCTDSMLSCSASCFWKETLGLELPATRLQLHENESRNFTLASLQERLVC